MHRQVFAVTATALLLVFAASAQQRGHHDHDLNQRGEQGMGFSQEKTTHHFLLAKDGGAIQVTAKSADDKTSIEQIRHHLKYIRNSFQSGQFDIPMFVHDQTPPGVPVMSHAVDKIRYRYEEEPNGGRVVITTDDKQALAAVHDFLRFQIREHKTGDPLVVQPVK